MKTSQIFNLNLASSFLTQLAWAVCNTALTTYQNNYLNEKLVVGRFHNGLYIRAYRPLRHLT